MAKCLWTTLKNNENDGKYRCAGRIHVKWRVVLEFGTEFGQTFLKIEINEHTLHMYFL